MKLQKYLFNNLLRKYNKCKRRLSNLKTGNRNFHRQGVLEKHITRMYEQLMALQAYIKRGAVATGLVLGAMALQPNVAHAQTQVPGFAPAMVNPFGLSASSYIYTVPAFADLDNDGDLDMLVGLKGSPSFSYYQNTGTNVSPSFSTTAVSDPFGLTDTPNTYATPAFVDLDHDGDMDIMAGDHSGNFNYYKNVGTSSVPSFTASVFNPFGTAVIGGGDYSHPSFADLDNDGDLDMMASSEGDGNFYYFQNIGTNTAPSFSAAVMNPFSLVQNSDRWVGATLGDLDHDGDFDIISQSNAGDFNYYQNIGTASVPSFAAPLINPFTLINLNSVNGHSWYATTFVDLNNDGRLDLMSGDNNGSFIYNQNVIFGSALNFNGTSTYIAPTSTTNIPVGNSPYTIEAWIKPNGAPANLGIIGWGTYGSTNQVNAFRLDNSGGIFNYWWGNDLYVAPTGFNLYDGSWHHLAATYDGITRAIYVDGVMKNSDAPTGLNVSGTSNLAIGLTAPSLNEYFNGSMDEVRVWNYARTQCQINNSMNCELAPSDRTGLGLYYKFNEGIAGANNSTITTLIDSSGNGNNGTLNAFALTGTTSNWVAPGGVTTGFSCGPIVTPTVSVNNPTICAGTTTTLTASGAVTYSWSTSAATAAITPSPTVTTTYTVTGVNVNYCMGSSAVSTVSVNPTPTVSIGTNNPVCAGQAIDFNYAGSSVTSYTWNGPASYTSSIASPTITAATTAESGTYSLSVTDVNGCNAMGTTGITVNPLPTVTVNSPTICVGNTATLTASGTATSYTWNTSAMTTSISATPTVTTNYTVTGADANGCMNMATTSIDVNSLPTVTASSSTVTLCVGHTATLTAGGTATSFTWSTGATTATIAVSPTVTTTYTLTGKNANGCDNMTTFTQSVSTCGVGIEQYSANSNEVTVYPNPNNGSFVVTTTENTSSIMVTDILGNELLSVNPDGTSTNINLSEQPSGVYFIKVISNGAQTVKRIIINN